MSFGKRAFYTALDLIFEAVVAGALALVLHLASCAAPTRYPLAESNPCGHPCGCLLLPRPGTPDVVDAGPL